MSRSLLNVLTCGATLSSFSTMYPFSVTESIAASLSPSTSSISSLSFSSSSLSLSSSNYMELLTGLGFWCCLSADFLQSVSFNAYQTFNKITIRLIHHKCNRRNRSLLLTFSKRDDISWNIILKLTCTNAEPVGEMQILTKYISFGIFQCGCGLNP